MFSGKFWPMMLFWILLQLIQVILTPIHSDEAYYRMYAEHLDWGYFDHPPMVALGIALGTWLPGTLGLRLVNLFWKGATLWLLYDLVKHRYPASLMGFWPTIFLLPLMHIYGVIATPDGPLLCFTACFFWLLDRLQRSNAWHLYLLLASCMAFLAYGKYHAVLVLGFAALPQWRLWKQPLWYLSILIAGVLFLPHLYWQYTHDWATFRYHLAERRGTSLWYHQLEYLGNVVLVFHPFLIYWLWRKRHISTDSFEKSAWFVLFGMIVFFSFQTLRDHVQPQWLVACYIPFVLLVARVAHQIPQRSWQWALGLSLPIICFLRLALVIDFLPDNLGVHRKKQATDRFAYYAHGLPIVPINSYQRASAYAWYQDQPNTHTLHTLGTRKSQYSIWMLDSALHQEQVFLLGDRYTPMQLDSLEGDIYGKEVTFYCYEKLRVIDVDWHKSGDTFFVQGQCINPYPFDLHTDSVQIQFNWLDGNQTIGRQVVLDFDAQELPRGGKVRVSGAIQMDGKDWKRFVLSPARVGWPASASGAYFDLK
jgi:hypothetical protein